MRDPAFWNQIVFNLLVSKTIVLPAPRQKGGVQLPVLVRLLDSPAEARILRPLITREIVYRLLMGEQGNRLRHLALLGGHTDRIAEAVERLRRDFNQPLRIDSLARELGMSVSGFHHHFKAVTAMSPIQFQKQIRLQKSRLLLLTGASIALASRSGSWRPPASSTSGGTCCS